MGPQNTIKFKKSLQELRFFPPWAIVTAHFVFSALFCLSYHWGYMSTLTDVGTFDQAIWSVLQGELFLNTNAFNEAVSYLGLHFRPILLAFVPFYLLYPSVEWLIIGQCLALSLSAFPVYLLVRKAGAGELAALFFTLAYLGNPFFLNVLPWVFRPETLAVPFITLALLTIETRNFKWFFVSGLFIMLCKEHYGATVAGLGLLWGLRNGDWWGGGLTIFVGTAYSFLVLGFVMPALSPYGGHVMLEESLGQLSRYTWLGGSFKEILLNFVAQPQIVLKTVFFDFGGGIYLLMLLIFTAFAPLAALEFFLPALADLAANLLSANPMPRSPFAYHTVSVVPLLMAAAIFGVQRISARISRFSFTELAVLVSLASMAAGYLLAPLPLPGAADLWRPTALFNLPDSTLATVRNAVGDNSSVSAQANVGAHFSQRREIYQFPNMIGEVEMIVLRLDSPTRNIEPLAEEKRESRKSRFGMLDAHLQLDRTEYVAAIEKLLAEKRYGIWLWEEPWLVLKFDFEATEKAKDYILVSRKMDSLRQQWELDEPVPGNDGAGKEQPAQQEH